MTFRTLAGLFASAVLLSIPSFVFSATTETYDSPGSYQWTAPAGVTSAIVACWGGGGDGGGAGGGGGGAFASSTVAVTPGNMYDVVVGGGGANGGYGATSTFNGSAVVAAPGWKDPATGIQAAAGGPGGAVASSTGDTTYAGGRGGAVASPFSCSAGAGGGGAGGPHGAGADGSIPASCPLSTGGDGGGGDNGLGGGGGAGAGQVDPATPGGSSTNGGGGGGGSGGGGGGEAGGTYGGGGGGGGGAGADGACTITYEGGGGGTGFLSKPPNNLGLVGYWSFDEKGGTTATDFSGNRNQGTLNTFANPATAASGWTNGKRGAALQFDGATGDFVSVPDTNDSLDLTTTATLAFWMKTDTISGDDNIIGKGEQNIGPERNYFMFRSADEVVFGFYDGVDFREESSTNANLIAGQWAHVAVTYNDSSNSVIIYINGAPVSDDGGASAFSMNTDDQDFQIGTATSDSSDFFDGALDEVRIYNRVLSASEITALFESGAVQTLASSKTLTAGSSLERGLIAHYTFDGADFTSTVADVSGNANNGYLYNAATSTAKDDGKLGQAILLDDVDDYVRVPSSASLDVTSALTISAWIKKNSLSGDDDLVIKGAPFFGQYGLETSGDELGFYFDSGGTQFQVTTDANLSTHTWYHVAVTYDDAGNAIVFYVNGVQKSDTAAFGSPETSSLVSGTDPLIIGEFADGEAADGTLDDVRIYSRVLTATEVKQLYNLGQAVITP